MIKIIDEFKSLADEDKAKHLMRFFKTGEGQYGEGDLFLGLTVPVTRSLAKKYYQNLSIEDIQSLLENPYHEIRLFALLVMVFIYEKSNDSKVRAAIFELYLKNVNYINNWDLVDLSASKIVGRHVFENKIDSHIYDLAKSSHLWSERISVVSQYYLLKRNEFLMLLDLSEKFLSHKHDLMHKAVGWMLREMGKVDEKPLYEFLDKHHKTMPRTMLRYSLEKLPQDKRAHYMKK